MSFQLSTGWLNPGGSMPGRRPVVFLHGFMGTASDFVGIAARLGAPAFGIDLPGHGGSTSAPPGLFTFEKLLTALAESIQRIHEDPVDLVGYSMGGRIAAALAHRYPRRVHRLIVESAAVQPLAETERNARLALDEERAEHLARDFDGFLDAWMSLPIFESLRHRPDLVTDLRDRRIKADPTGWARALTGFSPARQPSTGIPDAFICGALDRKYVEIGQSMSAGQDRVRLMVVQDAGHNVHLEQPDAYLAALKSILKTVSE